MYILGLLNLSLRGLFNFTILYAILWGTMAFFVKIFNMSEKGLLEKIGAFMVANYVIFVTIYLVFILRNLFSMHI